tara:strand:- start:7773 stop:8036 length:264 start_codon:yes stop_codon:yes gene_type:complete
MSNLTNNQIRAQKCLHALIVEGSDFEDGGYAFMDEMLAQLGKWGWSRKEAEGTIGSLLDSPDSKIMFFDYVDSDCGKGREKLYWMNA